MNSPCRELSKTNTYWNDIVAWLMDNRPNTQVTPSSGVKTKLPLIDVLDKV